MPRVRMVGCLIAASLIGTVLFNQVSFAKTVKPFRIFDWLGGATFDDQTNQFVNCSATSTNSRGISISYLVNDQYAWTLAFSNSSWNFSPDFTFVLGLKINDQMFSNQRAVFVSNQTLQVHLSDSLPVFEMLQKGRKLQVQARGINFDFELNASDEVLFALVDCVGRHTARGYYSKSNSRNAKRASAVKLSVVRDAAAMAEARSLASQIVAHAQIPNSQFLSPKDFPSGLQVDAVWKSGLVLGSVQILPPHANAKIGDVAIKIVEQAVSGCRGKLFAATALGEIDQSNVVRAVTSCRSVDMITTRNYLGIPRDSGGYYVLGTSENGFDAAHPNQRPAKELANKISAVITQVMSKFKPPNATVSE